MWIGKADHETIMYIGRHRRVQVHNIIIMHIVFHWSELAIWGHYIAV